MDKLNKLSLPVSIIIASLILGGFYYASQVNKQKSIENQQRIEKEAELEEKELTAKREECASLSYGVREKWNNVMGVTYDADIWEECVVTFTDNETGKVETSPLSFMKNAE